MGEWVEIGRTDGPLDGPAPMLPAGVMAVGPGALFWSVDRRAMTRDQLQAEVIEWGESLPALTGVDLDQWGQGLGAPHDRRAGVPGRHCFRCGDPAMPAVAADLTKWWRGVRWVDLCWPCYGWLAIERQGDR